MSSKVVVIIFSGLIFICSSAFGQYGNLTFRSDVSGPGLWMDGSQLTIMPGISFNIDIYCNHTGGTNNRLTWSSPFNFTKTGTVGDVVWGDTSLFPTTQLRSFFDMYQTTYAESWNGNLPDLFNFTGVANNVGYPNNLGEIKVFSFQLYITGFCYELGTFCIEQGDAIDNMYDWLFDDPMPTFSKKCWPVKVPPCDPPIMDNCPVQITAGMGEPATFQFQGHDPAGDPIKYRLLSGPGAIDSISGLWSCTFTTSDSGQVFPLDILVTDPCFTYPCLDQNRCQTQIAVRGLCGDINFSGTVNILDITQMINCLYKGGVCPNPMAPFDVDGNGLNNISDITYLINFLYKGGPTPTCAQWP
jgi:hypothetical protein